LTAQKRPLDFLDLARRSADAGRDDQFVLIGDGELAGDCDAFIARHGLGNVRRIPFCEDMSQLFPALDGLIITSAYEGLPISMLEALAMGLPVLSTDVGDVGLVLRETGSGWTFAPDSDADARWAAFGRWRDELPRLQATARSAAASVAERFSAQTVASVYERSWRRAQAERGGGVAAVGESSRAPAPARLPPMSVVIPTFNRSALLLETIERCRACAGPVDLEFVVIDDGSQDDTPARLAELADQMPNLTWRTGPNRGPGTARNLGASIAKHDLLLFLGDDIQPKDDRFFRAHAEIHARHPERDLAVLGKVTWPDRPWSDVNFVMAHIQGHRGEQFGYADLLPYGFVDWRFFYTANVSCKRALLDDWTSDGFSADFTLAAYEDAEFAYRMTQRPDPLRIYYAPGSCGTHHHPYSVESFLDRQLGAGMMARVFLDRHPTAEVRDMIGLGGVAHALEQDPTPQADRSVADFMAVVEGVKAWARLVESQNKLGSQWWHDQLLRAVFQLCYLQGFVMATTDPKANVAGAYYFLLEELSRNLEHVVHVELTGRTLGGGDIEGLFSTRGGPPMHVPFPRLRAWAKRLPGAHRVYLLLRRLRQAL
jgi:GT2 family glycosyltransferase